MQSLHLPPQSGDTVLLCDPIAQLQYGYGTARRTQAANKRKGWMSRHSTTAWRQNVSHQVKLMLGIPWVVQSNVPVHACMDDVE